MIVLAVMYIDVHTYTSTMPKRGNVGSVYSADLRLIVLTQRHKYIKMKTILLNCLHVFVLVFFTMTVSSESV